jgi:hypothetical protein
MTRATVLLFAGFLMAPFTGPLRAAEPAPAPLSLAQAVDLAVKNNL